MKQLKLAAALAVGLFAIFVWAPAASAATAPGFEEFSDCPDRATYPDLVACAVTDVYGGHLEMGTKDTPISDPIKLTIGIGEFANGLGATIDGGRQRIPGGLIGITGLDWLRFIYPLNLLQIYAEPELAGPVTTPFPPIGLPLKVQLHNVLLNNNCYIGANNDPISLNLTTGTTSPPPPNTPISGANGTPSFDPNGIFRISGAKLVDNAFAAPAARNCDLLSLNLLITALVNAQSGLPSPAGTNEAVQDVNIATGDITSIFPPNGIE
jgi:hypothetical protein